MIDLIVSFAGGVFRNDLDNVNWVIPDRLSRRASYDILEDMEDSPQLKYENINIRSNNSIKIVLLTIFYSAIYFLPSDEW